MKEKKEVAGNKHALSEYRRQGEGRQGARGRGKRAGAQEAV
jgi:hypothetical protein